MQKLFKYVTVETARAVLANKTLRWSAPETFNDPFEFKSPFGLGFEWGEVEEPFYDEYSRVATQVVDPWLAPVDQNSAVEGVIQARSLYKGKDPALVVDKIRPGYPKLLDHWRKGAEQDEQTWNLWRRQYRVLCLAAEPNNILLWSHYAKDHTGMVFAFEPKLELDSAFFAARPVFYSREVRNAGTLAQFIKYVTGQWPKPNNAGAFEKSAFTKSLLWGYENEWRILDKESTSTSDLHSYRPFDPRELVEVYFGCRTTPAHRTEIMTAANALGTPISFLQMHDERIRFELTPISITP